MVTKGYRKGVYDRVTEGTWESGRIGKCSRQSPVASLQQKTNGWTPRAIKARDPVGDVSRPGNPVLAVRARRGRWPSEQRWQVREVPASEDAVSHAKPWCSSRQFSARGSPRMNRRRPQKQEAAFTPTTYRCQIVSRVGQQAQGIYGSLP